MLPRSAGASSTLASDTEIRPLVEIHGVRVDDAFVLHDVVVDRVVPVHDHVGRPSPGAPRHPLPALRGEGLSREFLLPQDKGAR